MTTDGDPWFPTVDPNKERREAVKLKITKYLRRAEEIFNCHLQRTLGSGASPNTVRRTSLRKRRRTLGRDSPSPIQPSLPSCPKEEWAAEDVSLSVKQGCPPSVSHTLMPHSASQRTWHT